MSDDELEIYDKLHLKFREARDEFDLHFDMEEFDYMSKAEWSNMNENQQIEWL